MVDGGLHTASAAAPVMGTASFAATIFYSHTATRKTERAFTLPELRDAVLTKTAATKAALPWIKLARFGDVKTDKGSLRHDGNVLAITGIEADYDGERIQPHEAVERLEKAGVLALVYTSPSHSEDAPRWRVLCPTSEEMPPERRQHLMGRLNGLFGGIFSGESWTLSQSYYWGSVNANPSHMAELVDGLPIDRMDELDETWIGKPATETTAPGSTKSGKADTAALFAEIVTGAGYHQATVRLAGVWARGGVAYMEARARLLAAFDAVPEAERDARWQGRRDDVDRCLEDIFGKEARKRENGGEDGQAGTPGPAAAPPPSTGKPSKFTLLDTAALMGLPERGYLLKGIMSPGELSVWWGPPKCGKSFLMLHTAYALAQGRSVFGRRVKACRVLYLACEGKSGLRARVEALVRRWGHAPSFTAIAQPVDLWSAGGDTAALRALIAEHRPDLVVVDTINRVMAGGDENSSADMGALIRHLDELRQPLDGQDHGPHVACIHHGTKNGGNGPRGHGSLLGAVDASIEVAVEEDGTRTAKLDAMKDDARGALAFRLEPVTLDHDADGDPRTTCTVNELDEVAPKRGAVSLTPTEAAWMADLEEMFATFAARKMEPVPGEGPYLTLPRDHVRDGFRVRGRFSLTPDGNLTGADRERLRAMLNSLKNKGKIGLSADLVWQL